MITELERQANKDKFMAYCREFIGGRDGLERLLTYMDESGFYTAPSSTNFHLNVEGGLCKHSLNVFETARDIYTNMLEPKRVAGETSFTQPINIESIAISTLFHDLCKMQMYQKAEKWKKDEAGRWVSYPGYEVKDDFPFGHGEKSCFIIERFMRLKKSELLAIRWHMCMFDVSEQGSAGRFSLRAAMEAEPLVSLVQMADLLSANCLEVTTKY